MAYDSRSRDLIFRKPAVRCTIAKSNILGALRSGNAFALAFAKEPMMTVPMRMAVAVMLLIAATACGSYSSPTSPTATTVNVTITSGGFSPNPIDISVGSTVTWTNNDTSAHAEVADNGVFNSGTIAPGGQFSYTFPTAGTFTYHDTFNPSMVGTVNVSGSSSPSPY
jgi:plastocyanin